MSYSVHTTDAIIMRVIPQGEASLDVVFFTKELGKITARAQSARAMNSTMRMHLTRYNKVTINIVRGRTFWRLTGITSDHQVRPETAFARTANLVEHLVQGEMPQPDLFDTLVFLLDQHPAQEVRQGFELLSTIKILQQLGYWNETEDDEGFSYEVLKKIQDHKSNYIKKINEVLGMTQIMVY